MTFLGGSRACIGFKFAQLEMSTYHILIPTLATTLLNIVTIFQNCRGRGFDSSTNLQIQPQWPEGDLGVEQRDPAYHRGRRDRGKR